MSYHLVSAHTSTCPCSSNDGDLLCAYPDIKAASFYICWQCRRVSQVGVGKVERLEESQHERVQMHRYFVATLRDGGAVTTHRHFVVTRNKPLLTGDDINELADELCKEIGAESIAIVSLSKL